MPRQSALSAWWVQKPLSITVIAFYMLFGACLMPINIRAHAPAFLMGFDFHGSRAAAFFAAMGVADALIGLGVLRLAPWSRIAAIYFFLFRAANMSFTFLVPASRMRFEQGVLLTQQSLGLGSAPRHSPIWFGPAFELTAMALAIWFLLTRKRAFEELEPTVPASES
jgi:hypothetical protein